MAKIFLCDCCSTEIKGKRVTGELAPFRDLCETCHQGLVNLKLLIQHTKGDILKRLAYMVRSIKNV